ncbi:hypothetical protein GCM10020295_46170 [Streptomyces cinereospinus]
MVGTGRTAMGVVQFAEPGPGDVVVVPAAAGGIGTLLVQYAKNAGATVIGLAGGPEKTGRVAANGADLAVDYRDPDWPERIRAYDGKVTVVYDGVGGDAARTAVGLLAPGGRHIVFGWSADGIRDGGPLVVEGVTVQVLGPVMLERAGGPDPLRTLELRALAEAAAGRADPGRPPLPALRGRRRAPRPGEPGHDRQGGPGAVSEMPGDYLAGWGVASVRYAPFHGLLAR